MKDLQSSKPLNARDCLFLGKHAFNKGYYDKAIEWFEAALERSGSEEVLTAPKDEIEPFLQAAIKVVRHGISCRREEIIILRFCSIILW